VIVILTPSRSTLPYLIRLATRCLLRYRSVSVGGTLNVAVTEREAAAWYALSQKKMVGFHYKYDDFLNILERPF
jgi:hypothetical protein